MVWIASECKTAQHEGTSLDEAFRQKFNMGEMPDAHEAVLVVGANNIRWHNGAYSGTRTFVVVRPNDNVTFSISGQEPRGLGLPQLRGRRGR
jgi:hypothetical protein